MPNSEYSLIGGFNNSLGIYENKKGLKKKKFVGHKNQNFPLTHSFGKVGPKDFYVFGASEGNEVMIWNLTSEKLVQTINLPKENDACGLCVDYHEPTQRLAISGSNTLNASYIYHLS